MKLMKFTIAILIISGCWRPTSWTSLFKHISYNVYSVFVILILYIFLISQFMQLISNADDIDSFGDAFFNILVSLVACYKTLLIRLKQESIMVLINKLNETPYKPLDSNEIMIQAKFDKRVMNNTLYFLVLVSMNVSCMTLLSLLTQFKNGILLYETWMPFDYTIPILFHLTYFHQLITYVFFGLIYCSSDSLICGLLVHICGQIEILEYRLSNMVNNKGNVRDCVRHHVCIFEYAHIVNEEFSTIIPSELVLITIITCYEFVRLLMVSTIGEYIQTMVLTMATFAAIFYYCWFGNEMKLKSLQLSDNIYNMEWPILSNNVKRDLLMIMNRAKIPIEFSTAYIFLMDLETFVTVLKLAYSMFNVIMQSQKT